MGEESEHPSCGIERGHFKRRPKSQEPEEFSIATGVNTTPRARCRDDESGSIDGPRKGDELCAAAALEAAAQVASAAVAAAAATTWGDLLPSAHTVEPLAAQDDWVYGWLKLSANLLSNTSAWTLDRMEAELPHKLDEVLDESSALSNASDRFARSPYTPAAAMDEPSQDGQDGASSIESLPEAGGIAVTGAFIFTTLLLFWVLWRVWACNLCVVLLVVLPMITVDIVFWTALSANLLKLLDSGWLPMAVAGTIFFLMHTHEWGRQCEMAQQVQDEEDELSKMLLGLSVCTLQGLKNVLRQGQLLRTKSTAVFLTPRAGRVPEYSDEPFVLEAERVVFSAEDQSLGLWCATFRFGYAEPLTPARFDLHSKLAAGERNLELPEGSDGADNFTYVNRKLLVPHDHSGLCTRLRVTVYSLLKKNSRSPMSTFGLEGQSVLEAPKDIVGSACLGSESSG
eukprot:s1604_g1.t1